MKKTTKELESIIKKLWSTTPAIVIGRKIGKSDKFVSAHARKMGLPAKSTMKQTHTIPELIEDDKKSRESKSSQKELKRKYDTVLMENDSLKRELDASIKLKNRVKPYQIDFKVPSSDSEAVAFAIASDWHIEERVDSKTVNGMNHFTLEIAKQRGEQFFQHTLKLIKKEQYSVKINTLVLALLGDFISGNIHEELLENCSIPPIEAIIEAEQLLISGINFLLKNSQLKLIIPCAVGNHSRITKKVHISTERGNSLEYFMYCHMANYFKGNPRVEFRIAEGYLSYMDIYGYTVCFHHGHAIKFGGGVGGLTIPTKKAIAQWQRMKNADLHVFGHWHQFMDGGNFIVNGSIIGFNAFATFIKAEFDRPKQAFFLIDRKRKIKTTVAPILFDI